MKQKKHSCGFYPGGHLGHVICIFIHTLVPPSNRLPDQFQRRCLNIMFENMYGNIWYMYTAPDGGR